MYHSVLAHWQLDLLLLAPFASEVMPPTIACFHKYIQCEAFDRQVISMIWGLPNVSEHEVFISFHVV